MEDVNQQLAQSSIGEESIDHLRMQMQTMQQQLSQQKKLNASLQSRLNPYSFVVPRTETENVEWFYSQFHTSISSLKEIMNQQIDMFGMIQFDFADDRAIKKRGLEKKEGCTEKKFNSFRSNAATALSSLERLQDYTNIAKRCYESSATGKKSRVVAEKRRRVDEVRAEARKKLRTIETMRFIDDEAEEVSVDDDDNFC